VENEGRKFLGVDPSAPLFQHLDPMLHLDQIGWLQRLVENVTLTVGSPRLFSLTSRAIAKPHSHAARNSLFWYEMIRRATGCPIVVDSTKDPRRMKVLYLSDPEHVRVIYLVRDGRAVAASHMRRLKIDMATAAKKWVFQNRRSLWGQFRIPREHILCVHYEDLCRDTPAILRRICSFLRIEYTDDMLVMDKAKAHNIGGNSMRFLHSDNAVCLDERWRHELTPADLFVFQSVAGGWNRRLGYGV